MREFEDAVAVVTGGAGGIGGAIVAELAKRGARTACLDTAASDAGALSLVCDVTDEDAVDAAIRRVGADLGPVEYLVCAAGTVSESPVAELSLGEWRRVVDVSLLGTFLAARAVVPTMVAAGRGRIVAFSSGYARKGYRFGSHYAAAKAGVEAFVKSLALEVGGRGITVNAIAPGPVETAMLDEQVQRPGWRDGIEAGIPMARLGVPDDVVAPALFLLGGGAAYVTGQVLHVNGGLLMP